MPLKPFNGILRTSCPKGSPFDLFEEIGKQIDRLRPATKCDFESFAKSDWVQSPDYEVREECRIRLLAPDREQAAVLLALIKDAIREILINKYPGHDAHRTQAYLEI